MKLFAEVKLRGEQREGLQRRSIAAAGAKVKSVLKVLDIGDDFRQQPLAKQVHDFGLLLPQIAFPVVVNVGRCPATGVQQPIPETADHARDTAHTTGQAGDGRRKT